MKQPEMNLVESKFGWDFYIGEINPGKLYYNIVIKGSLVPEGGYRSKEYIEKIKHINFTDNRSKVLF